MAVSTQTPEARIIAGVGGSKNIKILTHCATRLRFQLVDGSKADKAALEAIPGVLAAMSQGSDSYQVVIGGGVEDVYEKVMALPEMAGVSGGEESEDDMDAGLSDADVKAAAHGKARGKSKWLDAFFEYLSDSFRPMIGVLLGASLIIAFEAMMEAFGVIDTHAAVKSGGWVFFESMYKAVFYFLPLFIAYNASKKLKVDPWVGFTIMAALLTPTFISLSDAKTTLGVHCSTNAALGTSSCITNVFGIPMQLNDYSGSVFVPLMMVPVLALVYKWLKKVIPSSVQLVFVPFLSMLIMIPVTAFLIGPLGIWLGNGLGVGMAWLDHNVPWLIALIIPMLYPFLVPLGLHWPLNALMLLNIETLGYDFIQGPMGAWNFACFGATAAVLAISIRDKDKVMRETAFGALVAGLLGGISEPSLYGIHLRFKRVYPRMLLGCAAGGITIAILGAPFGGVKTKAFAFTSLLTIPAFSPMWVYAISIGVAFVVAFLAVYISDYRTPEQKAAQAAESARLNKAEIVREESNEDAKEEHAMDRAEKKAEKEEASAPEASDAAPTTEVLSPVAGTTISLEDGGDPVFASHALGDGLGIIPSDGHVAAPVSGTVITVARTGHAFGIRTDDGVEVLIHVGIDTVKMKGEGFEVATAKGEHVNAGDPLGTADLQAITAAGHPTTVMMTVTNSKKLTKVSPRIGVSVAQGAPVIDVER